MKLTDSERKERYRIFWMVKGHFNCSEDTIINSYDSYFKRLWYNEEAYIYEKGFEKAWKNLNNEKTNISSLCR